VFLHGGYGPIEAVLATSLVHTISSPSPHADAAVGSWLCRPQP
jgi:hypothetical protein